MVMLLNLANVFALRSEFQKAKQTLHKVFCLLSEFLLRGFLFLFLLICIILFGKVLMKDALDS